MPTRDDIQRWRDRAEECRVVAGSMRNRDAAQKLLGAAAAYDRMIDKAIAAHPEVNDNNRV